MCIGCACSAANREGPERYDRVNGCLFQSTTGSWCGGGGVLTCQGVTAFTCAVNFNRMDGWHSSVRAFHSAEAELIRFCVFVVRK